MKVNLVRILIVLVVMAGLGAWLYPRYFPISSVKHYPNGQIFEKYNVINGVKNGPAVTYYANGKVRSEDNYKNGELDGVVKRYYEDGKYFSVNTFKNGLMDGLNEFYNPDGSKRSSEMYKNNVQDGLSRFFYPNGKVMEESEFVEGVPNGKHVRYYENGQLSEIVNFKGHLKHGNMKQFTDKGLIKVNHQYADDKLSGINEWYDDEGNVSSICEYTDGVQNGLCQWFGKSGVLNEAGEYKQGKHFGIGKIYYFTPPLSVENTIENPRFRSDQNLSVHWLRSWKNDKLDGEIKLFSRRGDLLAQFTYSDRKVLEHGKVDFEKVFSGSQLNSTEEEELFDDLVGLLFVFEDFDQIETLAAQYRKDKSRLKSGVKKLDEMYQGLARGFDEINSDNEVPYLDILKTWIQKYPNSITPRVVLVRAYTDIAWKYRGTGYAETISEEGTKKFTEYIKKAYIAGQEAMGLPDQDPELYQDMIFVGLGASLPKKDLFDFLAAGTNVDPEYMDVYRGMMTALLPRWGGRPGELEDFIDWAQKNTQEKLGFQLYAELYSGLRDYVGNRTVHEHKYDWVKLKKGFEEILADNPESFYYLNQFAFFASEQGDRDLSKKLFTKIGTGWDPVSVKIWENKAFYDVRRKWAMGEGALKQNDLIAVANVRDVNMINKIARESKDLNVQDPTGKTPLMIAIDYRNDEAAISLVEQGARVDIQDNDQREAVHFAAQTSSDKLMKLLLGKGALANRGDRWGYTPLHYAARDGFANQVKVLLTVKNVNINAKSNSGVTALHLAAGAGHIDVTEELVKSGLLDINVTNDYGQTPLHYAAMKGFPSIAKILLDHAADLKIKDKDGKTAADYAKENHFEDVLKLLPQ